jgi:hypothetical protein
MYVMNIMRIVKRQKLRKYIYGPLATSYTISQYFQYNQLKASLTDSYAMHQDYNIAILSEYANSNMHQLKTRTE